MKSIFTLLILCGFFAASAQTVNGIPLKEINTEYVQIVGFRRTLSNKLNIEIDFGQENPLFSAGENTRIRDASGRNVLFNSMMDALNFMSANGYEFVQAYVTPVTENVGTIQFLLRRKKGPEGISKLNQ